MSLFYHPVKSGTAGKRKNGHSYLQYFILTENIHVYLITKLLILDKGFNFLSMSLPVGVIFLERPGPWYKPLHHQNFLVSDSLQQSR